MRDMAGLYELMKTAGNHTVISVTSAVAYSPGQPSHLLGGVFAVKLTVQPAEVERLSQEREKMVRNQAKPPKLI